MPRACTIRTGLQCLPVELVCMIFENLEMHDLLTCKLVSRVFSRPDCNANAILGVKTSSKSGN